MEGYVLGIDGGGTKTAVCVADLQGKVLHTFKTGAININGESVESAKENLVSILSEAGMRFGGLDSCISMCIGAAGISNLEMRHLMENALREAGYSGRLLITGDYQTSLYGALGIPAGVILIAGTGSICYGRNIEGKEHRSGGFGYLIDDEGSGYAIGRDMLASVVRAYDGRREKTALAPMVLKHLGVTTIEEIIKFVYRKGANKREIAALAPILTTAYAAGDRAAAEIVEKSCNELFQLVYPVVERLRLDSCSLAMSGSILQKDKNICSGFTARVASKYPGIKCTTPENDAAYGAMLMALDLYKPYFNRIIERLE
jgi:N-acetylglucosamine kinase-like BadF-type ATPase